MRWTTVGVLVVALTGVAALAGQGKARVVRFTKAELGKVPIGWVVR